MNCHKPGGTLKRVTVYSFYWIPAEFVPLGRGNDEHSGVRLFKGSPYFKTKNMRLNCRLGGSEFDTKGE